MTTALSPRHLALLSGLLVLMACGKDESDSENATIPGVVTAESEIVTPEPFETTIDAVGTVVAKVGRTAALAAPVSARITRLLAVVGQRVHAGESLVELDRTGIDAAARSADAASAAADAAAQRAERLVSAGILPRRDAEQAGVDLARAHEAAATAHRNAVMARMQSPIAGVVTRVLATPGAMADPTVPLIEVTDVSAVDVLFSVTPADAAMLHLGQHVVMLGATAEDSLGVATITDIGAMVDSVSRGVSVRAAANEPNAALRIGGSVTGHVIVGMAPKSLVVPLSALVPSGEGFHVFVLDSTGMAHLREVTLGGRNATAARITAGLQAGERVVTTGAYGLDDSVMVKSAASGGGRP